MCSYSDNDTDVVIVVPLVLSIQVLHNDKWVKQKSCLATLLSLFNCRLVKGPLKKTYSKPPPPFPHEK